MYRMYHNTPTCAIPSTNCVLCFFETVACICLDWATIWWQQGTVFFNPGGFVSLPGETLRSHWRRLQGKTIYWVKCCTRIVILYFTSVTSGVAPLHMRCRAWSWPFERRLLPVTAHDKKLTGWQASKQSQHDFTCYSRLDFQDKEAIGPWTAGCYHLQGANQRHHCSVPAV